MLTLDSSEASEGGVEIIASLELSLPERMELSFIVIVTIASFKKLGEFAAPISQ